MELSTEKTSVTVPPGK